MKQKVLQPFFLSSFLLLFFVSVFSSATAQDARGHISGTVFTSDNEPGAGVTVKVSGAKGARADEKGYFEINNLKPGSYTLTISLVGYETHSEQVTVEADKKTSVSITLKVSQKELQEVVVTSGRNKVISKNTEYVARMPITNLQNPQVYSVVSAELIKQQNLVTLTDAFRNAPGVVPVLYPSGGIAALSRGFSTGIDARNGLQSTTGRSSADLVNIERIEFIKGPSGTLFGAGLSSFGGVVNIVTKKPKEEFFGSVDLSMGSYALARIEADVNAPLNKDKTVLFRVNTALQKQDSYNERGFYNSGIFAPSLLYKVNDRFTLLFDAELYSVNSVRPTYVQILPSTGFKSYADIPLDYKKSLLDNDLDSKTTATKFFVEGQYRINDNWTSRTNVAYVNEGVERSYQDYPVWVTPDSVYIDVSKYGPISNTYANIQQNFMGKFTTGIIKHTLLTGANITQYTGRGMSATSGLAKLDIRETNAKINRVWVDNTITPGSVFEWGQSNNTTYAAYASDVLNFNDRLFAMLSLRYEYIKEKSTGPWASPYTQGSWSPKLGLVYQPIKEKLSVFANYMNGFQNNPPYQQPDGSLLVIKPVYAVQYEGGIKAELFDNKVNTSLSYYRIGIDNAVRYAADGFVFQDGEQVSKGFEWDFTANPVEGLTMILGYGYNENRIVKATGLDGNIASNAPQTMVNYWINYRFGEGALKNFGLGAGGNYVSKAFFDDANTLILPSYNFVNASAFYETAKFRLGFKMNNIGDKKSWGYWGAPNATRNFVTNVTIKF